MPADNIVPGNTNACAAEGFGGNAMLRFISSSPRFGLDRRSAGFSLLEILVVLAIMMIITAMAVPTVTSTIDAYRLRQAVASSGELAQRCRMQAVKKDNSQRLHFATVSGRVVLFVTDASDTATAPASTDKLLSAQVWLPYQFSIPGVPTGTGAPPALTGLVMWNSTLTPTVNSDPYFNSRGLPCAPNTVTGICNTTSGFVYYFSYSASNGTRWSAISISPAGRIQGWFWNGSSWGN
jgi:type II secretory pathway pseudopilin PulG